MRTDEGRNKVRINDMQDELSLEAGPVIGLLRGHLSQAQAQGEVHRDLLALESFSVIGGNSGAAWCERSALTSCVR
jgi:hypothetical protein